MTEAVMEELATIRSILNQTAQQQAENTAAIGELRQLTQSNARSLEAMQSRIDGSFDLHERMMQIALEDRQQWREQRQRLSELYGQIADEQEDTRQSIQNLLEDARADRNEARLERERLDADRQRWEQSFAENRREHQAFRESFQVLLTEIARIWQRLAG